VLRARAFICIDVSPVEFGDYPMPKRYVRLSLISIAILAAGIPLSAAAYIALALIGF
jgi:hypothetical protein